MNSRVDSPLTLGAGGMTVNVDGEITTWESDEASAVFAVTVTQNQDGTTVTATGNTTATYHPKQKKWTATARVTGNAPLIAGVVAEADATGTITLRNGGTETYPWPNPGLQVV
jgi:hypothetical protein